MAQNVEVRLGFTADTKQAEAQLQQLQNSLNKLSVKTLSADNLTNSVRESVNAVSDLNTILNQSKTAAGTLDLSKFTVQLRASGKTLTDYAHDFQNLGEEGVLAFGQLAQSIQQANTPLLQAKGLLDNLYTQLLRTAKIQLSYGILNTFTGTLRSAYNYAQELNESLTDIQVITQKNSNSMTQFAREANKAAKSLSTSTTAYTNASLIYYQQGLSDEEVAERTETTIKLANITGDSAEEVSSYMTAIWNNFDDGSKSLEYFADVITKLGASTAASSEEIAEGLSQFSAVADTVGLSYEYATAALATVVAQTRQSADTVGTSFKTIFARLESLSLGETLDDDTTLTKYTAALEKVGVTVKEQNGDLKDMDDILDDLGTKWEQLTDQQKNALAYTVAGARQYTNFIALMDNWNEVSQNANLASNSTGTLQAQQDVYAQSWEASIDRVKSAAEGLYDTLINDQFFITINNGIAHLVTGIDNVIQATGGIPNLLMLIISLSTELLQDKLTKGLQSVQASLMTLTQSGRNELEHMKDEAAQAWSAMFQATSSDRQLLSSLQSSNEQLNSTYRTILEYNGQLTTEEQTLLQGRLDSLSTLAQHTAQLSAQYDSIGRTIERLQQEGAEQERINHLLEKQDEIYSQIDAAGRNMNEQGISIRNTAERLANDLPNTQQAIVGITGTLTTGLTSLTSIFSIFKTISNPDLSGWDKVTSITLSASLAIKQISSLVKGITSQQTLLNAAKLAELATEKLITKEKRAQKGLISSTSIRDRFQSAGINSLTDWRNYKSNTLMQIDEDGLSANDQWLTGLSETEAATYFNSNGTLLGAGDLAIKNLKANLTGLLPIFGQLAVAAGVVAAILVAYKTWKANNLEAQINNVKNDLTEAAAATEDAKDKLDSLNSSLEELSNNKSTYDDLIKGSAEWELAILQNNNSIRDLLKEYKLLGELEKYTDEDASGFLTLNAEGTSALTEAANTRYKVAAAQQYTEEATYARLQNQQTNNTTAGRYARLLREAFKNKYTVNEEGYYQAQYSEDMTSDERTALNNTLYLINADEDLRNSIDSLNETYQENEAAVEQNTAAALQNLYGTPEGYSTKIFLDPELQQQYNAYLSQHSDLSAVNKESVWKSYAEAMGYQTSGWDVSRGGLGLNDNYITFLDSEGNETGKIGLEAINSWYNNKNFMAANSDVTKLVSNAEEYKSENIEDTTQDIVDLTAAYEDLTDAQKENVDALKKYYVDVLGMEEEQAEMLSKLQAQSLYAFEDGIKNIDTYKKALKNGLDNPEAIAAANSLAEDIQNAFSIEDDTIINADFVNENLDLVINAFKYGGTYLDQLHEKAIDALLTIADVSKISADQIKLNYNTLYDIVINSGVTAGTKITEIANDAAQEVYKTALKTAILTMSTWNAVEDTMQSTTGTELDYTVAFKDAKTDEIISLKELKNLAQTDEAQFNKYLDTAVDAAYTIDTNYQNTWKSANSNVGSNKTKKQADRYKYITQLVSKLSDELDNLSDAEDRAFGADKLTAMNSVIDKYNQLLAANQSYLDQAEEYLAKDRAVMESYGAEFDANGIITEVSYQKMFAAHGNSDDSSDTWSTDLSNYESSLEKVRELESTILDYQNKIYDTKLEAITYKVEFQVDVDDYGLKVIDFLMEQIDDKATETAESFALIGQELERNQSKYNTYKQELIDILDLASDGQGQSYFNRIMSGEDLGALKEELNLTESAWKEVLESAENMMDSASEMKEAWEDYLEGLDDFWEAWDEKFQKVTDKIEHLSNVTSKYKDIVNLIGKDRLGISDNTMARLDQTLSNASINAYQNAKTELEAAEKLRQQYIEKGWNEDEQYKEQWENIESTVQELTETVLNSEQEMAEAFKTQFEDAITTTIEAWESAISGMYDDLDSLSSAFERANNISELYMESYEQAYNITKLTREIEKSISDTDINKNKQELLDLMDEINNRQATGAQLSEYEYNAYEKEYQLLLAKQALEDAQNAKNAVRMTRDANGNLGYVYTADQSAIDEATQAYDDVAYAYAQLNGEELANAQSQMVQLDQWLSEQLANSADLTEEEIQEIYDYYNTTLEYWQNQMEIAFNNNGILIDIANVSYWNMATTFEETTLSQITNIKDLNTYVANHKKAVDTALQDIAQATDTYTNQINNYVEISEDLINNELDLVDEGLDETSDTTEDLGDTFETEMQDMVDEAEEFRQTWEEVTQAVIEEAGNTASAVSAMADTFAEQASKIDEATSSMWEYYEALQALNELEGEESTETKTTNTTNTKSDSSWSVVMDPDRGKIYSSVAGSNTSGNYPYKINSNLTLYANTTKDSAHTKEAIGLYWTPEDYERYQDFVEYGFATGGYTGEWGTEGKLAFLHQKELVLNASDTENFLGAINIVRDIADTLKLQQYGANASLSTGTIGNLGQMQQNVTITAEFPNATDHNEIEIAFDDLMNRASMLMNRN